MLNDSYWKEYNNGERAYLYSADNKKIAYVQKKENLWQCTIYPEFITEEFNLKGLDSLEEVEWQVTLYIYNRCNNIANQLHRIRDHLPSIHELAEKAIKIKKNNDDTAITYDGNKYKCNLLMSGDSYTSGSMMLTKEEYEIVKKVTDVANWDNLDSHPWSGSFEITCEELDDRRRNSKAKYENQ